MRKIIDHVRYDTDNSQLLAVTDTGTMSERLYRTSSGHYFQVNDDTLHAQIDQITPLTEKEAIAMFNKLLLKNPLHNPKRR